MYPDHYNIIVDGLIARELIDLLRECGRPTECSTSRRLPCTCGANYGKIYMSNGWMNDKCRMGFFMRCSVCNKEGEKSKTRIGAIRNWNHMIEEKENAGNDA